MFGVNVWEVLLLALPLAVVVFVVVGVVVLLRRSADTQRRVTALEQHRPAGDADLAALRADLGQALRHVAVVRYDAFSDVGGRLSYSMAVVDDTASGFVLTTLAGKSDVRTYVRAISGGGCEGTLTDEEQQAIIAAVGSRP